MTKMIDLSSDLAASAASLRQSAAAVTQVVTDERQAYITSMQPLIAQARTAADTLETVLNAHSRSIEGLYPSDDERWTSPAVGRNHPVYSRLDNALSEWRVLGKSILPLLRRVGSEVNTLSYRQGYQRDYQSKDLARLVRNNIECAEGAGQRVQMIARYAKEVSEREAARLTKKEVANG